MPHLYTCRQCRTRAPERRDRLEDAEADRQTHRDAAHGGHVPIEGDSIRRVYDARRGDGLLPRNSFPALLFMLALLLANCHGH